MASLQFKFGALAEAAPPPATTTVAPSFMVFFDWARSNLSAQALNTILSLYRDLLRSPD